MLIIISEISGIRHNKKDTATAMSEKFTVFISFLAEEKEGANVLASREVFLVALLTKNFISASSLENEYKNNIIF